ncbi:hypothetical protein BJ508DRAFT_148001 [Ascobolus immersus RN42]|uniref:Uncharacterized protein n=1 Tax=Ascobolus immersus RN42 TaxID=1160509 RepID=A0A3N4IJ97_ASCIM|nr:hypothetical protein BJ508DRAFT_148001 [Ascobolus immersus RN42]
MLRFISAWFSSLISCPSRQHTACSPMGSIFSQSLLSVLFLSWRVFGFSHLSSFSGCFVPTGMCILEALFLSFPGGVYYMGYLYSFIRYILLSSIRCAIIPFAFSRLWFAGLLPPCLVGIF